MWQVVQVGDLRIDPGTYRASFRNRETRLTPKEFKLLLYLAKRTNRIITHQKLVLALWGEDTSGQRERLRVLVGQVRKKIEALGTSQCIVTEPWIGYRFEPPTETVASARRELANA